MSVLDIPIYDLQDTDIENPSPYLRRFLDQPTNVPTERKERKRRIIIDDASSPTDMDGLLSSLFGTYFTDVPTTNEPRLTRKITEQPIETSYSQKVLEELTELFTQAEFANSEANNGFYFPDELLRFIDQHREDAIDALNTIIEENNCGSEIVAEALTTIGRSGDYLSYPKRLELLLTNLRASSPKIRYGATRGLASLNSSSAISDVEAAIENEKVEILRHALIKLSQRLKRDHQN